MLNFSCFYSETVMPGSLYLAHNFTKDTLYTKIPHERLFQPKNGIHFLSPKWAWPPLLCPQDPKLQQRQRLLLSLAKVLYTVFDYSMRLPYSTVFVPYFGAHFYLTTRGRGELCQISRECAVKTEIVTVF